MDVGEILTQLAKSPAIVAIYLCIVVSVANWLIGAGRAVGNGTFLWSALGAWIRRDGGKLVPIFVWLLLGAAISLVDVSAVGLPTDWAGAGITAYGVLQAGSYILSTLASLRENPDERAAKVDRGEAIGDPVPTD